MSSGPPGWTTIPESEGGRYILTPLTVVAQPDDPTFLSALLSSSSTATTGRRGADTCR